MIYSQKEHFVDKDLMIQKILMRSSTLAINHCNKILKDFDHFIIVDTTFEEILIRQTVNDSVQKIDFRKQVIKNKIELNLRLIDRIKSNQFWYPLKRQVYEKEIEGLDEEVLKLLNEVQKLTTIRIQLLETPNMDEIDYYKITFIGDSKNKHKESMFWYTTIFYEPSGEVRIANFDPK